MGRSIFSRNKILWTSFASVIILSYYYVFVQKSIVGGRQQLRSWELPKMRQPRIFCAIMTMPANHKEKAAAVRDTWSKRCDRALFFTSDFEPDIWQNLSLAVTIKDNGKGRDFLWAKTRAVFLYIYEHYADQFDWFLKSDDDTYFIIDNLRSFLSQYNQNDRVWFGCEFVHSASKLHFPSGGAGYVLSRGAIRAFGNKVKDEAKRPESSLSPSTNISNSSFNCGLDGGKMGEDVRFSLCLQSANVTLIDTQGPNGEYRFLPTMLEHFVYPERNGGNWWINGYRKLGQGIKDCCHKNLISIHYAHPKLMYLYEFLVYHLQIGEQRVGDQIIQ